MARGFARLAAARAASGDARERALARVREAMLAHPDMVAGTQRFDTALMQVTHGRLVTKTGAEAIQCVGIPSRGIGLAIKVTDGTRRAVAPAVVGWLSALGLLAAEEARALDAYAHEPVINVRERVVGSVVVDSFPAWRSALEGVPAGAAHPS